jgi:hypothetical protein
MFFRVLWFLIVTWLFAGLFRLLTGVLRSSRGVPRSDRRPPTSPPTTPRPYSRDEVVDARFVEVEKEPPGTTEGK